MWGYHSGGWAFGMLLWMAAVWAAVLITAWIVFRDISGPKHHLRH
jgi:hypothetical protein